MGYSFIALILKTNSYIISYETCPAFNNLEGAKDFALYKVPLIVCNVLSAKTLRRALTDVNVVVHVATYVSVEESFKRPSPIFQK